MLFLYEICARDLKRAMAKAELDIRKMALEIMTVVEACTAILVVHVEVPAVGEPDGMRPHTAHLADEMLRSDRAERAVGHAQHVHRAAAQHIRRRLGAV